MNNFEDALENNPSLKKTEKAKSAIGLGEKKRWIGEWRPILKNFLETSSIPGIDLTKYKSHTQKALQEQMQSFVDHICDKVDINVPSHSFSLREGYF